jgi:hypothetical protein
MRSLNLANPIMYAPDYVRQPPAWFSSRILVGPGERLTPTFARINHITHVINCAQDPFCPEWWKRLYPSRYAVINAVDSLQHNILDWYPLFEDVLRRFLRDGYGVVYVHCHAGMNRSASLALAYVCKNYSLPFDPVVVAVRRQRPCILQNPVFMNQVKDFIYGHLQSTQDTRLVDVDLHSGNSGLVTSDNRAKSEGLQDPAADAPRGDGHPPQ